MASEVRSGGVCCAKRTRRACRRGGFGQVSVAMLDLVYLYASALLANWFAVVTGSAPLLVDQVILRFVSERWRKWSDDRGPWRRRIEVGFLIVCVVWAGFAAWKDEHKRADDLAASINGKNGYVAQLASADAQLSILRAPQAKPAGTPSSPSAGHRIATAKPHQLKAETTIPGAAAQASPEEMAQRQSIITTLTNSYIQYLGSHGGIPPDIVSGEKGPPDDWMNNKLTEYGYKWRVKRTGLQWYTYVPPS